MKEPETNTRRWVWTILLLLVLGGAGYSVWRWRFGQTHADQSQVAQTRLPSPVPVQAARVETTDVPIYLLGLGNVQAFNTVTVRSRVDGEIVNIAFKEGQIVQAGDLLVQIDPRPFQAVLDQAKAKLAQDQAQLANFRRDLARYAELARPLSVGPTSEGRTVIEAGRRLSVWQGLTRGRVAAARTLRRRGVARSRRLYGDDHGRRAAGADEAPRSAG